MVLGVSGWSLVLSPFFPARYKPLWRMISCWEGCNTKLWVIVRRRRNGGGVVGEFLLV